jgi:hypothetical protein
VVRRPRLGGCGGTFTDMAGRPKTSCLASRPLSGDGGLSETTDTRDSSLDPAGTTVALTSVPISGSRYYLLTRVPGSVAVAACTVGEVTGGVVVSLPELGRRDTWSHE